MRHFGIFVSILVVVASYGSPIFGQTQKLTPSESALANQAPEPNDFTPLHDYIPCTFGPGDRDRLHAFFNKPGSTPIAAARTAIESSGLPAEQILWAQNQISILAKQPGVTLGNVAARTEAQLANPPAGSSENKLTPQQAATVGANVANVVNDLKNAVAPNDIGCSESVLTYDETKDIFGKRMANIYIAVQVTIRNLNGDNEFLLHDIQVAVDSDLFFATRDKRLARGVAEIGAVMSPRNQTMRYFDAAASGIASAAIPIGSTAFSNAALGFSAFIPVLKGVFPDFTIAQLGRVDDLGFTSGSLTYVIPKSGAHAMVAFIPEKVFRNQLATAGAGSSASPSSGNSQSDSQTKAKKQDKYKNFKDYTTADLRAFQNSVEILIAGVHVKEVSTVKPDATGLTCKPATGTSATDTVTCDLTGKNLQAAKGVKLVFKSDSTEESAKSTKYTVNTSDTTKAEVVFSASDFSKLKKGQPYSVVLTSQDDVDINTSVTFTPGSGPDATSLTCSKPTGSTVACQLVGSSLKSVTQLKLEPTTGSAVLSSKFDVGTDDTKATVTFSATDFASLKAADKYSVVLVSNGKDAKSSLTFSPAAPAAETADASSIKCVPPKAGAKSVSCALVGKNLDLVKELSLVPPAGKPVSSSNFTPDATDDTEATVTFTASDFSGLVKGQTYKVVLVPKTGANVQTSATYKP